MKQIMVVDDDREIAAEVSSWLEEIGYGVLRADNGLAALEMARKANPDLIVLDLMLPKMDGYTICGLLKNDSRYAKIPILMFSARGQEEDAKLALESGADVYVTKPADPEFLLKKIQCLIEKKAV